MNFCGRQPLTAKAVVSCAGLLCSVCWPYGCSSEELDAAAVAGGGGAVGPTIHAVSTGAAPTPAGVTSGAETTGVGGGGPCAPEPLPPGVPEGWVEYTDWSCSCRFYVPGTKAALPQPIAWEKCSVVPAGVDCQAMKVDWSNSKTPIGFSPMLDRDANGKTVLGIRRIDRTISPGRVFDVIVEPDGQVRSAILRLMGPNENSGCYSSVQAIHGGRQIFEVYGADSSVDTKDLGAIGGAYDELHPKVLLHHLQDGPLADSYSCGAKWIARENGQLHTYVSPWDLSKEIFVTAPWSDPEGLSVSQLLVEEDAFFWSTTTSFVRGINSWNPVDGTRPFIRYIGDATRGAANLGTDGAALVWSYGEGKKPEDEIYPTRSIMTAPFTTDPKALMQKRLRSDPDVGIGVHAFQVACGKAAHGGGTQDVIVVRLSDGVGWAIKNIDQQFSLEEVIGITCDHVYALARIGGRWNVARIKLDSLGTGAPPD